MLRTLIASLLTASAAVAVPVPENQPGPPPVPVRVRLDDGRVVVEVTRFATVAVEEDRTQVVNINGQMVQQTVKVTTYKMVAEVLSTLAGPKAQVFDLTGRLVDPKQLAELFKKAPQVLLSADDKPVHSTHLSEAQPGTLILVAPDFKLPAAPQ